MLTLSLFAAVMQLSAPVPKPNTAHAVLEVDSTSQEYAAALLVRVKVVNKTDKEFDLDNQLGSASSTVQFYIQKPGETKYSKYTTFGQGRDCSVRPTIKMGPSESLSCIELIYLADSKPLFDTPGKYKIYVEVRGREQTLTSAPLEIMISKEAERKDPIPTETLGLFYACIQRAYHEPASLVGRGITILQSFPKEMYKQHAAASRAFLLVQLAESDTQVKIATVLADIERHCKELPPIELEQASFQIAKILLEKNDPNFPAWIKKVSTDMAERSTLEKEHASRRKK